MMSTCIWQPKSGTFGVTGSLSWFACQYDSAACAAWSAVVRGGVSVRASGGAAFAIRHPPAARGAAAAASALLLQQPHSAPDHCSASATRTDAFPEISCTQRFMAMPAARASEFGGMILPAIYLLIVMRRA